jgi:hypothetical protein
MRRAAPARAGEGTVRENTAPPRPHELHTTPLGAARLCKNLGFAPQDVIGSAYVLARQALSAQGQKLVYHICGLRICGQRGQRDGHYRTPPPAAAKRLLTNRFRFAILKNSSYAAVFYAHPGPLCPGA